jgi:hypothetical protein
MHADYPSGDYEEGRGKHGGGNMISYRESEKVT